MDRRTFLAGTGAMLLATPLAVEAQQAGKVHRIGYLNAGSAASYPKYREKFVQGLRDLGYVEGRDFVMEYRYAEGEPDRLPGLAAPGCRRPPLSRSFLLLPVTWWKGGS